MKKLSGYLYFWVLIAIIIGGLTGYFFPHFGTSLKPIGDGFIALIKMLIAPVIFCTVALGISGAGDVKKVGRVGLKSILYFETVSNFSLLIGLAVVNIIKPGKGFNVDPSQLDTSSVSHFTQKAKEQNLTEFFLHLIPKNFIDAFTSSGDLLQVLLLAILFGFSMNHLGEKGKPVHDLLESFSKVMFGIMKMIMKLAPLGAGAAMAFTFGKFGQTAIAPLFTLMASFYLTCVLFVIIVLGAVAKYLGFNILHFLKYIKEELITVLGTSSSESVLLPMMEKLEKLGCSRSVVGLVVPAGYSFNLDGTNIYLSMAAIFIAQALNIELSIFQQFTLLIVAMLTSNGASGVTGAGFITLAATLQVVPEIPVAGLALILGIDRFMSEARSITNCIGNGVAALAISRWENELDLTKLRVELKNQS